MSINIVTKETCEKHKKYLDFYTGGGDYKDTMFWGLGIENETYMMTENLTVVDSEFLKNNTKRERYSVNYFSNYNMDKYKEVVNNIETALVPHYINAYMIQNTDIYGQHKTTYTKNPAKNPKFCGMTIHEYMKYMSKKYTRLFDKNVIFDGDTIEFTTNRFYKTTVNATVSELNDIKHVFLREINKYLANKFVFSGYGNSICFPKHNYGFVKYMTNMNNIGICNSGTYHINITMPTEIKNTQIVNPGQFKKMHCNAIRIIQWFEPFIIALYGTPDILSCAVGNTAGAGASAGACAVGNTAGAHACANQYCKGSLRLMMSRYIGLGTYDTDTMEIGKKLNDFDYKKTNSNKHIHYVSGEKHYFNKLHNINSAVAEGTFGGVYNPPETIGYDFNYNKFKNHGIELRVFDYFPEEYLSDVINFLVLLCQHSLYFEIRKPQDNLLWNDFVVSCIKNGSDTMVSEELYLKIREICGMPEKNKCCFDFECLKNKHERTIMEVIVKISDFLYEKYKNDPSVVTKMSPDMKKIVWVNYNKIVREFYEKNTLHMKKR